MSEAIEIKREPYKRYQKGLVISDVFPEKKDGFCDCGCGRKLTGRRTRWATEECSAYASRRFWILKGDMSAVRRELYEIDGGFCRSCGVFDMDWEADHIIPVKEGGGGLDIDNFQTLCRDCHKDKSANE